MGSREEKRAWWGGKGTLVTNLAIREQLVMASNQKRGRPAPVTGGIPASSSATWQRSPACTKSENYHILRP